VLVLLQRSAAISFSCCNVTTLSSSLHESKSISASAVCVFSNHVHFSVECSRSNVESHLHMAWWLVFTTKECGLQYSSRRPGSSYHERLPVITSVSTNATVSLLFCNITMLPLLLRDSVKGRTVNQPKACSWLIAHNAGNRLCNSQDDCKRLYCFVYNSIACIVQIRPT